MTEPPNHFIDNRNGNTMAKVLGHVFGKVPATNNQDNNSLSEVEITTPDEVRIASAFFSPAGFQHIAGALHNVPKVRLMLGADLPIETNFQPKALGQSLQNQRDALLTNRLQTLNDVMQTDHNHLPFNPASVQSMRVLINALETGRMEIRRYEKNFLHAKAYIYTSKDRKAYGTGGIFAGSSNLTSAGLTTNLELNIGRDDQPTVQRAVRWFDALWEEAVPVDDLLEMYSKPYPFETQDPWLIFMSVLYQLYGDEINVELNDDPNSIQLTSFQNHGVMRAKRLIQENGGALVADEVGLGKTFIAGEIINSYRARGQRTLLICPAAIRDTTWKDFLSKRQLFCEAISFHGLAANTKLNPGAVDVFQDKLERDPDEYQLIVVDEAHNYRNPNTITRAQVLRRLLGGRRKDVLMLTATPVNNSLWDLHTLLDYFVRQDSMLADRGVISIRERFKAAARRDPADLSPDMLYPIIDATTVKRTRQFVKKHYSGDTIVFAGKKQTIKFPEPKPITVRYDLEASAPGLMEAVFLALDPDEGSLSFARYGVGNYLLNPEDNDELMHAMAGVGLLRSGLLKRFESSAMAFRISLQRIRSQCNKCIFELERGRVLTSEYFAEISADDYGQNFDDLINAGIVREAHLFDTKKLTADLENDIEILSELIDFTNSITQDNDAKLNALNLELEKILSEAQAEATSDADESNKRKLLIFSYFVDTANWIYDWLSEQVETNPKFAVLKGRIAQVTGYTLGSRSKNPRRSDNPQRSDIVRGFAPVTMGASDGTNQSENRYDVLVTTDVLAEGVNLQQCRNIVNYDLPWNPMRLVQRHGRIDRIGSEHSKVFLRSIFPDRQLDDLLHLEQRILDKIAMAAATVGVQGPIEGARSGSQIFSETIEELKKLADEDPSIYERGGPMSATQSGEEYRQQLRVALQTHGDAIKNMPWRAGSGMVKGTERGIFFSAYIGNTPQLCFVRACEEWKPSNDDAAIEPEIGTCLRLIEAEQNTNKHMPVSEQQVYLFWDRAVNHFYREWQHKTDPINLQPQVSRLNRDVIEFLESTPLDEVPQNKLQEAIEILSGSWGRRDEKILRAKFREDDQMPTGSAAKSLSPTEKATRIINWITAESGLRPVEPPKALDPIERSDIKLLCWMALEPESGEPVAS